MDENVPLAITEGLRRRGVDVLTAQEDGRGEAPDPEILDRAMELGRVLFTRDQDFFVEASERQASGEPFSGVIYAAQTRVGIGQCIDDLELIGQAAEPAEYQDRVVYLPPLGDFTAFTSGRSSGIQRRCDTTR